MKSLKLHHTQWTLCSKSINELCRKNFVLWNSLFFFETVAFFGLVSLIILCDLNLFDKVAKKPATCVCEFLT